MSSVSYLIVNTVVNFIQLYLVLIFVRILLSWFQTAEWAGKVISFFSTNYRSLS